ncbi:conserved hypothetical protein [Leptospira interrogans serovar Manilae]|uniref:Uncharacterized protein n=1 Tax=Leptospira interrogans serovar Manilae TaxID=214675 RepID=A0AAQ1P0M0_LEPIR|nr:hypothetical protein [Leptospira interrogans]AKP25937.1 hypothetical protein LIMLP_08275 [Leptospira interrogans serovar Manilae]AKP29722.1 hypothetical protein LIMHP_08270 [Leptospira interrogans serovar Manilae]EYU62484.1 hypothetical protein CI00_20075 [Leptospira interrogans serovar Manilae]SOR63399.1 conserved hypothetical protein [Leptospira interrogans serovar Manilae]
MILDLKEARRALQAISANSEAGTKFRVSFANAKANILHSQNVLKIPGWLPSGDYTVEVFQVSEEEESPRSAFEFRLPNKNQIQFEEPTQEPPSILQNTNTLDGSIPVSALNALLALRKEDQKEIDQRKESDRLIWETKIASLIDSHKNEIERIKELYKNEIERLNSSHKFELALTQGNLNKLEEAKEQLTKSIESRLRKEQKSLVPEPPPSFDINTITQLLSHPLASVFISKLFGVEIPAVPALAGNPQALQSIISEVTNMLGSGEGGGLSELLNRGRE